MISCKKIKDWFNRTSKEVNSINSIDLYANENDLKIFYHEDFYRQVELVPEENYFSSIRTISEMPVPIDNEYGFYNCVARTEQKIKLLDRKILLPDLKGILTPICLLYSGNVHTGYGQSSAKALNTIFWGFEGYGIFVKYTNDIADAIFLSNYPGKNKSVTAYGLQKALFHLMNTYSLVLIDWDKEIIVRPTSEETVKQYLVTYYYFDY